MQNVVCFLSKFSKMWKTISRIKQYLHVACLYIYFNRGFSNAVTKVNNLCAILTCRLLTPATWYVMYNWYDKHLPPFSNTRTLLCSSLYLSWHVLTKSYYIWGCSRSIQFFLKDSYYRLSITWSLSESRWILNCVKEVSHRITRRLRHPFPVRLLHYDMAVYTFIVSWRA